jgi:hypothetical protein
MNPNHYLAVAIQYLVANRPAWRADASVGRSFRAPVVKSGFSRLPAGIAGSAGTLGGTGTAISAHSPHRQEAIADKPRHALKSTF